MLLIQVVAPLFTFPDGTYPSNSFEKGLEQQAEPAVEGTRALLHAAAEAGIQKLVLTSLAYATSAVPPDPQVFDERCSSD